MVELGGRSWQFEGIGGADVDFDGAGSVSGSAGVNRFRGSYAVDGDILRIGPLATTRMAGTPDAMAREQRLLAVLARPLRASAEDGAVLLDDGTSVLRLVRRPVENPGDADTRGGSTEAAD